MIFNHEWWFDGPYQERLAEAKRRCTASRVPHANESDADYRQFCNELEARTIIYLRDGFSYEVKAVIPSKSTTAMVFECMPADEAYKVGAFVVTVPFDEIVRVEVFSFHPKEKPEDMPSIKGFAGAQSPPALPKRPDDRQPRREAPDHEDLPPRRKK